ncbi:hypothetical protein Cma02nite_05160 [Cellulomonas marina]|nr:hypothetical protein Cma02nite_05160 [Cellulomonas marina]
MCGAGSGRDARARAERQGWTGRDVRRRVGCRGFDEAEGEQMVAAVRVARPVRATSGTVAGTTGAAVPPAPVGHKVLTLLARADGELVAARLSAEAWEVFSHAHLAALRAAGAVVEHVGPLTGRRAVRTVWDLLETAEPGLASWAHYFAAAAPLRAAVDAGSFGAVPPARAQAALEAAERFVEAARDRVERGYVVETGTAVTGLRVS